MHSDCPSNETLAAFLDGRLDSRTRAEVAAHITSCDDCYALITDVAAAREAIGEAAFEPHGFTEPAPARRNVLPFRGIAAAAVAIAAGFAAAAFFIPGLRESVPGFRSPSISDLAEVADEQRVTIARVSGIDGWRPAVPVTRGPGDGNDENYGLEATTARIEQAASKHPTVRNLHNLGVALLLEKEPERAIETLERAARMAPPDAALLNDLAAAYYDRGQRRGVHDDAKALAYAERAWQLAQEPASAWNRALALGALERRTEAVAAWEQYLAIEKDPQWQKEARQHLAELRERP